MNLSLASIHVYPIKSLGGFSVTEVKLTDRGLENDRRWMLVDEAGVFLSQREISAMACLHTSPLLDGFKVADLRKGGHIMLPWMLDEGETQRVSVWSDQLKAIVANEDINAWFSEALERPVRLVYMPDKTKRRTDGRYAKGLNSLSDGFPYQIVSQASLDDLNEKLTMSGGPAVPMDRFRPNFVIAGGEAFQEDAWEEIFLGEIPFALVKPCVRCVIVTIDQRNGARGKEPLRTLATYRSKGNKVLFAMNAVALEGGVIHAGDPVMING